MKTIGRTEHGEFLVQMSAAEHLALTRLQGAITGLSPAWCPFVPPDDRLDGSDLKDALTAVRDWVLAKYRVNDLQRIVDDCHKALGLEVPVAVKVRPL